MPIRIGILTWSMVLACTGLAGCATDGTSAAPNSFMGRCLENATTEQDRSECAWKNADRMASGN
jgi:hypothetical protein